MFLILSAAYIDQELKSEFGPLPPAFLPIGNRRLFQYQVESAPKGEKVYLTLPESFKVLEFDQTWLDQHKVNIVKIPDNISLGESLVIALNLIEDHDHSALHVLHGDTLSLTLPEGNDIVGIATAKENYNWAVSSTNSFSTTDNDADLLDEHNVIMGYFKFSNPKLLIQSIIKSKWGFIEGLNLYHQQLGLNTIRIDGWLDFGHVNTYYQSKSSFTTQRAFNDLRINSGMVIKSSEKQNKIKAEAQWFQNVPPLLRKYLPQYLGHSQETDNKENFSYYIEYLHNTALNELYVFSALPDMVWNSILSKCLDFIDACKTNPITNDTENFSSLEDLLASKTTYRVKEFCNQTNIDPNQRWQFNDMKAVSINDIVSYSTQLLPISKKQYSVMHGDFCFSNILYDFRSDNIKTFDPRGLNSNGEHSIYGDITYDIAKLSHSVLGMYDAIIAGYYILEVDQFSIKFELPTLSKKRKIQNYFINIIETRYGLTKTEIYAMQIHLFLSMLSLHSDNKTKQTALMANAFRLYHIIKEHKL